MCVKGIIFGLILSSFYIMHVHQSFPHIPFWGHRFPSDQNEALAVFSKLALGYIYIYIFFRLEYLQSNFSVRTKIGV